MTNKHRARRWAVIAYGLAAATFVVAAIINGNVLAWVAAIVFAMLVAVLVTMPLS